MCGDRVLLVPGREGMSAPRSSCVDSSPPLTHGPTDKPLGTIRCIFDGCEHHLGRAVDSWGPSPGDGRPNFSASDPLQYECPSARTCWYAEDDRFRRACSCKCTAGTHGARGPKQGRLIESQYFVSACEQNVGSKKHILCAMVDNSLAMA